jgi:hypothetical protein
MTDSGICLVFEKRFRRAIISVFNVLLTKNLSVWSQRSARRLAALMREMGWQRLTTQELMRLKCAGLATVAELELALSLLEDADCIRAVVQPAQPQGGRPTRLFTVNPALLAT